MTAPQRFKLIALATGALFVYAIVTCLRYNYVNEPLVAAWCGALVLWCVGEHFAAKARDSSAQIAESNDTEWKHTI